VKKIFISYRRSDGAAMAGRLYDSLCARFGQKNVFFDIDTIHSGDAFHDEIKSCLAATGVLIAVIGGRWHRVLVERSADGSGVDYVATEIDTALQLKIPVVPVLVGEGAAAEFKACGTSPLPLANQLATFQAIEVDEGKDYRNHVDRLIRDLEKVLGIAQARRLRLLGRVAVLALVAGLGFGVARYDFWARYSNMPQDARSVGLQSVEDRSDPGRSIPPEVVFRRAKQEVFISGVSCYRTFDQHRAVIDELADKGVALYVLLMDPDSAGVAELSAREKKPIGTEIRQVIEIIRNNGKLNPGCLQLRLMSRMPTFTAVMVDGDVAMRDLEKTPSSTLRVQPLVGHSVQHQGIILEFGRHSTGPINGFDFYAEDLRKQWSDAAVSDGRVAEMLRISP
jgi:hypothetical protein